MSNSYLLSSLSSSFQLNTIYKWSSNDSTPKQQSYTVETKQINKNELFSTKFPNIELKSSHNSQFCDEIEKVMKIKLKIRRCTSIAGIYNEIKNILQELDEYKYIDPTILYENGMKKFQSYDNIDFGVGNHLHIKKIKQKVDCGTQTDHCGKTNETKKKETMKSKNICPPPIPPASFLKNIEKNEINQKSKIPPPPPLPFSANIRVPNAPLKNGIQNIPLPPPMPITNRKVPATISSTSTNIANFSNNNKGIVPPPLPMPSADAIWFNEKCKLSIMQNKLLI